MPADTGTPDSPLVVNLDDVALDTEVSGAFGGSWKVLTPGMLAAGGKLGVVEMRLSKGHTTCPFHHHLLEDEVFIVRSGRGVLRYGDDLREIGPGDCISCPAGTGVAHQIANPYDADLVYLAIGPREPHEVCAYPDSGKVLIRGMGRIGFLEDAGYSDGEPERPKIFDLWAARNEDQ